MIKYMLDTNIVIYTMKNKPAHMKEMFVERQGQMCVSTITSMELFYGAEHSQNPKQNLAAVEGFLARLDVLEYDTAAAANTGQLRSELRKAGTPIGPYDGLIAGHARSRGFVLVTNNVKEFERVDGLRIENWADPV